MTGTRNTSVGYELFDAVSDGDHIKLIKQIGRNFTAINDIVEYPADSKCYHSLLTLAIDNGHYFIARLLLSMFQPKTDVHAKTDGYGQDKKYKSALSFVLRTIVKKSDADQRNEEQKHFVLIKLLATTKDLNPNIRALNIDKINYDFKFASTILAANENKYNKYILYYLCEAMLRDDHHLIMQIVRRKPELVKALTTEFLTSLLEIRATAVSIDINNVISALKWLNELKEKKYFEESAQLFSPFKSFVEQLDCDATFKSSTKNLEFDDLTKMALIINKYLTDKLTSNEKKLGRYKNKFTPAENLIMDSSYIRETDDMESENFIAQLLIESAHLAKQLKHKELVLDNYRSHFVINNKYNNTNALSTQNEFTLFKSTIGPSHENTVDNKKSFSQSCTL